MAGRPRVARRLEREFWRLIATGVSTWDAAAGAGVSTTLGTTWFRQGGGMPPIDLHEPTSRFLSFSEREEIAVWNAQRVPVREMGRRLGRSASTVSRELRRNNGNVTGRRDRYRAMQAQSLAEERARRPKTSKLAAHPPLQAYVQDKLMCRQRWSPEQISRRLRVDFPDDKRMGISPESIYQAIYVQGRGALRRDLAVCLRTGRALRKPRKRVDARRGRVIPPEVMISERPAEVDDRAVAGHWEGDLIIGKDSRSAIGTLVERTTRFTMLLHLPTDHGAEAVRDAILATIVTLPDALRRTLSWDQGVELARHADITFATQLAIYFCDPHSPWQRGTNENTNGLLRQYFPRGTNLSVHDAAELRAVADALNGRPRKTLDWATPAEALDKLISIKV